MCSPLYTQQLMLIYGAKCRNIYPQKHIYKSEYNKCCTPKINQNCNKWKTNNLVGPLLINNNVRFKYFLQSSQIELIMAPHCSLQQPAYQISRVIAPKEEKLILFFRGRALTDERVSPLSLSTTPDSPAATEATRTSRTIVPMQNRTQ